MSTCITKRPPVFLKKPDLIGLDLNTGNKHITNLLISNLKENSLRASQLLAFVGDLLVWPSVHDCCVYRLGIFY